MKKEHAAFLIGGLAFGFLFGYLVGDLVNRPGAVPAGGGAPVGRQAAPPSQGVAGATAPMMEEISALKRLLEQQPDNLQALTRLANMYHDAQMWNESIGYYRRALEVSPGNPNLLTDMGICYQGLRQFDRALELFREAQAGHPEHWQSLYNIAVVSGLSMGRFDEAYDALDRLAEYDAARPHIEGLRRAIDEARAAKENSPS